MKTNNYIIRNINSKLIFINPYLDNDVMVFDGVSKEIINRLLNSESISEITNAISSMYNLEYNEVERDVLDFIENLKETGIYV